MAVVEEASADPGPRPQGEIDYRLGQQRILARFGMDALRSRDLDELLQRATELCAAGMNAGFCKYLEAPDEQGRMLVRSGVGWAPGIVGTAYLYADLGSPAGFAYKIGEPVISNHLDDEERFRTPAIMAEHGIKRAINVLVEADANRYGVIEVDSTQEGKFDEDDLAFMQGFANLIGVAIERQHAEGRLNAALEHQELLVREASHRVKNSLALVSAMLNLQMQEDDDPRIVRLLGDAQARITAIAQTHDQLWRGDRIGIVALDDLASGLVTGLREQAPQCRIECSAEPIAISADTAIPLGLMLTELVTNAIKYAGGEGQHGRIDVRIAEEDGAIAMTVSDNGPGMPEGFDIKTQSRASLGMRMIASLTRQLGGTIAFTPDFEDQGTRVRLSFPNPRTL
ncbi:GAF domain-containing protein [Sphingomonas sp. S1-29]|uniref:sensor histidine kinase n=1 Tax=Sphingomonas sp. S1-29 TaxID=2991074 RepID=UPI00223F27BC|nr:histidine kinase dimerization/phosphoacceptor domain -containing protein [Sphingomonas sp. S1-29]UZK70083.1 GAF domain-containing protein [Sphingomonas sp. S1-29]